MLLLRHRRWSGEHTRLVALAAVLVVLVLMSRSPQMLVARMSTEGSQDWYGASYDVPQRLTLRPDSFNDIPVTLDEPGPPDLAVVRGAAVRAVVPLAGGRTAKKW